MCSVPGGIIQAKKILDQPDWFVIFAVEVVISCLENDLPDCDCRVASVFQLSQQFRRRIGKILIFRNAAGFPILSATDQQCGMVQ